MMNISNARWWASGLAIAAALGCSDLGTGTGRDGQAGLTVLLTDAPGDVTAAVVTITDIYLQGADSGQSGDSTSTSGRVYLRQDDPVTTDLLSLSNDVLELVDNAVVPAGKYSQLRFVVSGGYLETEGPSGESRIFATSTDYAGLPDGAVVAGELKCPSCSSSGFKVKLGTSGDDDIDLAAGADQTLLVDFDVSRSLGKEAGNSGKWILRPVLKAVRADEASRLDVILAAADSLVMPTVNDTVITLQRFGAALTPVAGGDPKIVPFGDSASDEAKASFRYVLPGDYVVHIVGPDGVTFTTDPAGSVNVTIEPGTTVETRFELQTAS